jgi:hypothetical protein
MNGCGHFDIIPKTKQCSVRWNQQLETMHRICHHCEKILEVGPRSGRSRRSLNPSYPRRNRASYGPTSSQPLCYLKTNNQQDENPFLKPVTCKDLPSPHYPVYFFTFIILACVFSIASVILTSVSLSSTSIDAVVSEPLYFSLLSF